MTEILDSKEIGDRIRQAREKAGMNRKELAEKLNLAASCLSDAVFFIFGTDSATRSCSQRVNKIFTDSKTGYFSAKTCDGA